MSHRDTALVLSERGLFSILGGNGAGKSAVIEAVSVGLWGRSLRDASPWREGEAGEATVELDNLTAVRSISKAGVKKLRWWLHGHAEINYSTTTKAQEALNAVVGTWEMWRRTHVLSSQDVASFSVATNAEKCRLLEHMLGIGRFDKARELVVHDLNLLESELVKAEKLKLFTSGLVSGHGALLRASKEALAQVMLELPAEAPPNSEIESLELDIADTDDRIKESIRAQSVCHAAVREASSALMKAAEGKCPVCGAEKPRESTDPAVLGETLKWAKEDLASVTSNLAREEAQQSAQRAEYQKLIRLRSDAESASKARERSEAIKRDIQKHAENLLDAEDSLSGASVEVAQLTRKITAQKLAAKSLSVGGARAHVLERAIKHVEDVANIWMERLAPSLSIKISPYTEGASGATRNEIAISVLGAGGKDGYAGCSGGERRRADTVLMLALGEAAAAAHGSSVGTLWLDEIFESLDVEGRESFESVLSDLCADRAVVFISHIHELPAARCFRVTKVSDQSVLEEC